MTQPAKRRMTFGRGLAVAFIAAVIATAIGMAVPRWGLPFSSAALVLVPGYLLAVAPTLRRGIASALIAFAVLGGVAVVGFPVAELGLLVLGITRGTLLFPTRPLRGIVTEGVFLSAGIGLGVLLFAPGTLGVGLATWGFFLVQSCYPLFAGSGTQTAPRQDDPFNAAMARASALLEDR